MATQPPDSSRKHSRLEEEIEEILMKADRPPTPWERLRAFLRRRPRVLSAARARSRLHRLEGGAFLAGAALTAVAAFLLRDASHLLARSLAVIAVILLLTPIVLSFAGPRNESAKRWRGREIIDVPPSRPSWLDRMFKGPRRPPRR
ncbi:MAG: hypothetical protein C4346_13720 [Chloroflexota bacterium]